MIASCRMVLLLVCAFALPGVALAQSDKIYRVGLVAVGPADSGILAPGMVGNFTKRGYVVDKNIVFERRAAQGKMDRLPGLIDEEAKVYAEVLTTEDLRQAVAFYQSQAGKDLLATIPAVTDRITPLTYAAMPKMFATVNDDYCKHVKCSDDIRASFKLEENMMATMLAKAPHPAK